MVEAFFWTQLVLLFLGLIIRVAKDELEMLDAFLSVCWAAWALACLASLP